MSQRILVAIDLSDASIGALNGARAFAKTIEATLAVVFVLPHFVDMQTLFPQTYQSNLSVRVESEALAAREVERRLAEVVGDDAIEIFMERGDAYAEIVRRAEAWTATLIVVGSHGRTGLARALLGSVAERVVRYAHCPVLVTRPTDSEGIVMAATDLSDPSLPAIARGAEEARRRGARFLVVHAVDRIPATYVAVAGVPFGSNVALPPPEVQEASRAGLVELLRQSIARFDATGEPLVLDGAPVAAIVRAVDELRPELLVVGTHGRTGLSRIALGSVAEQLVRLVHCSVLAVRAHSTSAS